MSNYSIYPKAVDGYAQIPLAIDKKSPINAESVNRLRSGIINIETAIGIAPEFSSKFGSFPDFTSRVSNIEDIMVGLESSLSHSLTGLVENLDIPSFVDDLSLTGLYERDNVVRISDEPLLLEGEHLLALSNFGSSYLDFFVDENFVISSSTGLEFGAKGSFPSPGGPEMPSEWPKSVIIRESEKIPFEVPGELGPEEMYISTYLSLGGEADDSDLVILKGQPADESVEGGIIGLFAGIKAATDESFSPLTLEIGSFEALRPGLGGGSINISSGDSLYEADTAGKVSISSGEHPLGRRSEVSIEGPGPGNPGSIGLYTGDYRNDGEPTAYGSSVECRGGISGEGGKVTIRAGEGDDHFNGGSVDITGGKGDRGGNIVIASGESEAGGPARVEITASSDAGGNKGTIQLTGLIEVDGELSVGENLHVENNVEVLGDVSIDGSLGNTRVAGSLALPIETWTSSIPDNFKYTLTEGNFTLLVNAEIDSQVELPIADASNHGRLYNVKRVDDPGVTGTTLNINTAGGGQTIDGDATILVFNQWNMVSLQSDGSNWYVVGTNF